MPSSRNFAAASSSTKLLFFQPSSFAVVAKGVTNIEISAWLPKRIITEAWPRPLAVTRPEAAISRIDSSIESYLAQAVTSRVDLSL